MTQQGAMEPWLTVHGVDYTREQAFALYSKAERGELLTDQEARVAGAWCVHPLNTPQVGHQPYVIGALLMKRQLVCSHGQPLSEASGSAQSEAKESSSQPDPIAALRAEDDDAITRLKKE